MVLWIGWILIPTLFLLVTFWTYVEARRKKNSFNDSKDLFRQVVFLSICTAIVFVIDIYVLDLFNFESLDAMVDFDSKIVVRIILFPFIAMCTAHFIGPTDPHRIKKAPALHRRNRYDSLR